MFRVIACAVVLISAAVIDTIAQQTATAAKFEVAAIRVNRSGDFIRLGPMLQPGGRVLATNVPLVQIIRAAYALDENQLIGAPDWADTIMFDVDARASGEPTPDAAAAMVRELLADRFALKAHTESRQLPVYLLTRVSDQKTTPGLSRSGAECAPIIPPPGAPPPPPPPGQAGIPLNVTRTLLRCPTIFFSGAIGHVSARAVTMERFASALTRSVRRPVIDRTGLSGEFDINMTYRADLDAGPAPAPPQNFPDLFTAIREQLGLRLESGRAPVEVLVVDRVERPADN